MTVSEVVGVGAVVEVVEGLVVGSGTAVETDIKTGDLLEDHEDDHDHQ